MSEARAKGIGTALTGEAAAAPKASPPTLEALYHQYWAELCNTLKKHFGAGPPEPEDVAQAAFTKYASLKDPSAIKHPKAFLFTTARNIVLDHKRKEKRLDSFIQDVVARTAGTNLEEVTPERVYMEKERFAIMTAVLKELPRKQQVVLTMNRLEGKTFAEIRAATGWSMGDIHRQLKAGIKAITDALDKATRER